MSEDKNIEHNLNSCDEKSHMSNILKNPHQMLVGSQYKITEPDYDDIGQNPYIVEVIKQMKDGFILVDIEHNFTFERTFKHLMTCEIVTI
jgi:hypothetical protein